MPLRLRAGIDCSQLPSFMSFVRFFFFLVCSHSSWKVFIHFLYLFDIRSLSSADSCWCCRFSKTEAKCFLYTTKRCFFFNKNKSIVSDTQNIVTRTAAVKEGQNDGYEKCTKMVYLLVCDENKLEKRSERTETIDEKDESNLKVLINRMEENEDRKERLKNV